MPFRGSLLIHLFVFTLSALAAASARACDEGQVQMDECFCYKLLPNSLMKRELGASQSFEIDTSIPPVPAQGAPDYCVFKPKEQAPAAPKPPPPHKR